MEDKNAIVEKGVVVTMFVLVLVVFSFAQRDTDKLFALYSRTSTAQMIQVSDKLTAEVSHEISTNE